MSKLNADELMNDIIHIQSLSGYALEMYVNLMFTKYEGIDKFFTYTYDTILYQYNVRVTSELEIRGWFAKPVYKDLSTLFDWLEELNNISSHSTYTKHIADMIITKYGLVGLTALSRKVPGARLGAKTINKAVGYELITDFRVQKAKDLQYEKIQYPVYVERKYDGNNVYIIRDKIITRNGKLLHLPHVQKILQEYNFQDVLVCEMIVKDGKLGTRNEVQGLSTKARKQTITGSEESRLSFKVLDYLTYDEWQSKKCYTQYVDRRLSIINLPFLGAVFSDIHLSICSNEAEVRKMLAEELRLGYEGIVVKPLNHYFTFKRSWDWMRVKEAHTLDAEIVGLVPGTGKHADKLGAFNCRARVDGKLLSFSVGTGFSDLERERYNTDDVIGKIIELTYNAITEDGSVTIPVFKCFREDKETCDNG